MRIPRRRLLKTTGAAGALALTGSAGAQWAKRYQNDISPIPSRPITSRVLTETSQDKTVPAGSPFRFGLALQQGDVPAGSSIGLRDGDGNAFPAQFDAINYWPDGSVRFCEVRGYTIRAISAGGIDTISIFRSSGSFDNALPGGTRNRQITPIADAAVFAEQSQFAA